MPQMFMLPFRPAFDGQRTVPGAQAWFTATGTNTEAAVYTSDVLTTPRTNPVVANGIGNFPKTYLDSAVSYRLRIYSEDAEVGVDDPIEEYDPYIPGSVVVGSELIEPYAEDAAASALAAAEARDDALAAVAAVPSAEELNATVEAIEAALEGIPAGTLPVQVATRLLLAAITPSNGIAAILTESGRVGVFRFTTANMITYVTADTEQGIYVAPSTDTTGTSGAWVRQWTGPANVKWFGASGDGTTDDGPEFLAALACLSTLKTTGYGYARVSPGLIIPAGVYNLNTSTLDLDHALVIEGESTAGFGQGGGTVLKWATGTTGIRTQFGTSSGATSNVGGNGFESPSTIIRNLTLYSEFAGTESEAHGIHVRGACAIRDVGIFNFPGDGIYSKTNVANSSFYGASNGTEVNSVTCQGCRNGIYIEEADSNGWVIINPLLVANRRYGIWGQTTLGGTLIGGVIAANGMNIAPLTTSMVHIGGSRFYVLPGQEAGAATNPPKSSTATITVASPGVVTWASHGLTAGTPVTITTTGALPTGLTAGTVYYVVSPTTNEFSLAATAGGAAINTSGTQSGVHTAAAQKENTWWGFWGTGGTADTIPAWTNGIVARSGGAGRFDSSYEQWLVVGVYQEQDHAPFQVAATAKVIFQSPMAGYPAAFDGSSYGADIKGSVNGVEVRRAVIAGNPTEGYTRVGGMSGGILTHITTNAADGARDIYWSIDGGYYKLIVAGGQPFAVNQTNGRISSVDVELIYKQGGTQVVGARKTGWTAATGTATRTTFDTATVTLPQLAERLKALIDDLHNTAGHGLIGT